ncbi:sensor histidine kinase [Hyphobacterium indicum]|uniref:sensor histidine kinase n=1 Tax=Hyphobacterium indicum TaxID=2162714 RepID=UPI000D653280|nr:HAMP domain-containing sensor histidine kinase [Hyphobacterium indicum]
MRLINPLLRYGGLLAHLTWVGVLLAVAPLIINASPAPMPVAMAGIAAGLAPGLAGLLLARQRTPAFGRLVLALLWVSLAASITAASGGLFGPAALAFLLPVASAASYADRRTVVESAALAGLTALLSGALQLAGFLTAPPGALMVFAPGFLAAASFITIAFSLSALRGLRSRSLLRALAAKHLVRSRAFEQAPLALVAEKNGEIIACSRVTRDLMPGMPPHMDGVPVSDLAFDADDSAAFRLAADQTPARAEIRGASGRPEAVQLFRSDGGVIAIVSTDAFDSPVRAANEQLVMERDTALAETHAKSEFLASVSHEIRTPLNAIIGFSDAMKSRLFGPVPAKYAEYAELIHESGRHLLELIGDVLDLSKIEADSYSLSHEAFDAGDVIELCTRMLSQRAEDAGVTIELDAAGPIPVRADRKALRQILLNLLSNAIKFTPRDGVIVVMASAQGGNLTLAVGDSGPGIAPAELAQLGQRYMQASTTEQTVDRGSGLGLSLVKALAEMHGGEMTIKSALGEGTTVSVTLPVIRQVDGEDTGREDSLEVHSRIQRAQQAGQSLASSAG